MTSPDTNVGFVLDSAQQTRVAGLMERILDELPQGYSVLIDRAGRIVNVCHEPVGVQLEALSALSAGCYATTNELAKVMGEEEYSLLFRQEDDNQVYVWPVADRALLVVLLKTSRGVEMLEERLGGPMGRELVAMVRTAKLPDRPTPPPRIVIEEIPYEVRTRTRNLTALITSLQTRMPEKFNDEIKRVLLKAREEIIKSITAQDWRRTMGVCEWCRQWLFGQLNLSATVEPRKILPRLYIEVFSYLHGVLTGFISSERLTDLYRKTYTIVAKRRPWVCLSDSCVTADGIDARILWERAAEQYSDIMQLAREFVPAVDEMVRELVRVVYVGRGGEGRNRVLQGAKEILARYRNELLALGLEGVAGEGWLLLNIKSE